MDAQIHHSVSYLFRKGQPSLASPLLCVASTGDWGHAGWAEGRWLFGLSLCLGLMPEEGMVPAGAGCVERHPGGIFTP